MNYYNDHDASVCAWLRELIAAGHLPEGIVDERSVADLRGVDLSQHRQVHLFAGIGGWPFALRLAGWDPARPVWTGSCPCQPFSSAGKRRGTEDERHLWPEMRRLIAECHPPTVFGEQVASRLGREWLAGVFADLEALGYACAGADLCAASVGAPHIRQRLFWVGNTLPQRQQEPSQRDGDETPANSRTPGANADRPGDGAGWLANTSEQGRGSGRAGEKSNREVQGWWPEEPGRSRPAGGLEYTAGERASVTGSTVSGRDGADDGVPGAPSAGPGGLGDANGARESEIGGIPGGPGVERAGGVGFWSDFDLVHCRDGKWRRIPPGGPESPLFPLAPRLPGSVGLLRGAGNSICPQVAALFIRAYLETET